jgi:uncharacterized damage-inducible protein DinB
MKRYSLIGAVVLTAVFTSIAAYAANPQAAAPAQKPTVAAVYDRLISVTEKQVVDATDAMPEDKFNFAPTGVGDFKGVRTFAQQAKHIAAVNYLIGAAIVGEKSPVDINNEKGPDNITSKADVMKFLKDSFAYARKAAAGLNESNLMEAMKAPFGDRPMTKLAMVTIMIYHPYDHYGQMVEYLRMNSIIPPASRGGQ